MHNGLHRNEHETLDNSDVPKLMSILLKFMSLNKNCSYDTLLQAKMNFNTYFKLPLTNESIKVSDEFKKALDLGLDAALKTKDLLVPDDPHLLKLI